MRAFAKCATCGKFYIRTMKSCPLCNDYMTVPIQSWTEDEIREWGRTD